MASRYTFSGVSWRMLIAVVLSVSHTSILADKATSLQACIKTAVNYGDVLSCTDNLSQANVVSPSHDGKEAHGTELNDGVSGNEATRSF